VKSASIRTVRRTKDRQPSSRCLVLQWPTHVIRGTTGYKWLSSSGRRIELQAKEIDRLLVVGSWAMQHMSNSQGVLQIVIHLKDRSLVTTSVTIVWCREDGNDISILRPSTERHRLSRLHRRMSCLHEMDVRITFHNELMRTSDQSEPVVMVWKKTGQLDQRPSHLRDRLCRLTESFTNILSERVSSTSGTNPPPTPVIWVRP
jgi:hypothetical protein